MRDPFADLRAVDAPADPEPEFAERLRTRLERALALPRGVTPVTTTTDKRMELEPRSAAVPYLAVDDARGAIEWYVDVFGARLASDPIVMPDGRVGHAELALAGGVFYLADEHPELGVVAPSPGAASVSLMLPVADADEVRARALAAGARGDREPYDGYGSRNAWIVDPFGHRWGLHSPLPATTAPRYLHGDIGYVSVGVPGVARAADFYAGLLGWRFTDGGDDRRHTRDVLPSTGITASSEPPTLFCCFAVDDVRAATERVRAAGGTAGEPSTQPYGVVSDCVDDQGVPFALYEQPADVRGPRPPANGARAGDLGYLTLEVVDSARTRAFYGAVLGWQFSAGRVADGWRVEDTVPMIGIRGGHERTTAVPMWRVDDVEGAVAAVRASGGSASDPEQQPYGTTSECADDQGFRFNLGRL